MAKCKQREFDFNGQDLPLFSGTPVQVSPEQGPVATASPRQLSFVACRVCLGAGVVEVRKGKRVFCSCPAGQRARAATR